jgi:adsorption protein B
MAIFVPAWDEADVIGAMLARLTARLDHDNYRVFVGVYPNDPATLAAVTAVGDARIQPVVNSRPGPTSKADCLNALWQALLDEKQASGRRFKAVVLHDAEDVVHPLELRIFDALMPRLAMVQLPVRPLPDAGSRWISGHYLDEFAESHGKDLVVREAIGAALPSAGVGCAIDRAMLAKVAALGGGLPFDPACITEDYELGHRIKRLGGRGALVRLHAGGEPVIVATHEHFPATFEAALRQKSRWLAGIALSGWDRIGWPAGVADRYMLWRDRKGLLSPLVIFAGYLGAMLTIGWLVLAAAIPAARAMPPLAGPVLKWLLTANALLLGWRLAMRFGFTARAYGWREGLRALPRAVVANAINAVAALRALDRYRAGLAGQTLAWEKTAHRFPAGDLV